MDLTSIISIVVLIVVIYFLIKFIVSPIIRLILGVIIILIFIYIAQRYLNFDIDQVLAPFGISLNINGWLGKLNWLFEPINYYLDQAKNFFTFIWGNFQNK
jgi:hypothetical protein